MKYNSPPEDFLRKTSIDLTHDWEIQVPKYIWDTLHTLNEDNRKYISEELFDQSDKTTIFTTFVDNLERKEKYKIVLMMLQKYNFHDITYKIRFDRAVKSCQSIKFYYDHIDEVNSFSSSKLIRLYSPMSKYSFSVVRQELP